MKLCAERHIWKGTDGILCYGLLAVWLRFGDQVEQMGCLFYCNPTPYLFPSPSLFPLPSLPLPPPSLPPRPSPLSPPRARARSLSLRKQR